MNGELGFCMFRILLKVCKGLKGAAGYRKFIYNLNH